MDVLSNLRIICNDLYNTTKDNRYIIIGNILSDDNCFFYLDLKTAYSILRDLNVSNPNDVYKELVSVDNFKKNNRKIKIEG